MSNIIPIREDASAERMRVALQLIASAALAALGEAAPSTQSPPSPACAGPARSQGFDPSGAGEAGD